MADIKILGTLNCVAEDGTLARANQIDVNGTKLPEVLNEKEDKDSVKQFINPDHVLESNTEYYLGEISDLTITLPQTGTLRQGDMFYITYNTGQVPFEPTITGAHKGLEDVDWLIPHATYELCGKSNGNTWLIAWKVSTT